MKDRPTEKRGHCTGTRNVSGVINIVKEMATLNLVSEQYIYIYRYFLFFLEIQLFFLIYLTVLFDHEVLQCVVTVHLCKKRRVAS